MTLTTHIRIVEPTPVKPIFDECRRLLNGQDVPFKHDIESWASVEPKNMSYRNQAGAGLHALLYVVYGADGPLSDYPHEPDETGDGSCICPPKGSVEVIFDTAYSYSNAAGGHCSDLHAWLILELASWLNERDLTWFWQHEYTGEWFPQTASPDGVLGNAALGRLDLVPV